MGASLYHSPLGLFDFQALGVGKCYVHPNNLAVWSTGIGKTHLAMATGALLFEDDLIDLVLVTAEVNKLLDWVQDFRRFTDLTVLPYKGTPSRRHRLRTDKRPQVLVGTYETVRNDAARPGATKRSNMRSGPLVEDLTGLRVLFVYDECSRLKERGTGVYRAHETMIDKMRQQCPETRVLGLTATPFDRDPTQAFNGGRIIAPENIGSIGQFEADQVAGKDIFGKPNVFKNLGPADCEPGVRSLQEKLSPALFIKSKFDDDVKDQFPKQIEEFESVALGERHLSFYETVRQAFYEQDFNQWEERMLFGLLRQIAGHPLALTSSQGKLATAIMEQVGYDGLEALGCAKLDWTMHWLDSVVRMEGAKAIIFTFFGQSVLPLIHQRLRQADYNVVINHGQMDPNERQASINALRYGDAEIFLSSDAGSKGLNLPEATYVLNYELPLTYANYRQRADRVHRIDSMADIVVTQSLIAADTIEEGIGSLMMKRNVWNEQLLADDDEFGETMDAAQRRQLIAFAKQRTKAA